ncbi:MAG TPA: bifunctional methylenetetrahydrofolate dehydrogenase/methenyltetrahydrofolate cyclohydrolase FolD [Planctomycetes bacterium]|nr:bifunctional methylenetetrahydrofolate dehydrogenase/methenyltetrahydrofolate cyclohydrolase FolD [Planctomycetota bacterium]
MSAKIIDGKEIALSIHQEVRTEAEQLRTQGITPGLATVLVGDDPASRSYVKAKRKACEEDGIQSFHYPLPAETSQADLLTLIAELGADPKVHGILVQLPLPSHIQENAVIQAIPPHKDVDGFHPENLGRLGIKGEEALFAPCTPAGVLELLKRAEVQVSGARAVVLGRSKIVGLPAALLLLRNDATVTVCHSRTKDLPAVTREADILIAAIGRANFVNGEMVKPGAAVIDVGVNRVEDASRKRGYRLVGDCDFEEVSQVAGCLTPVPGGVGPMTIAMLMKNTVRAARAQASN